MARGWESKSVEEQMADNAQPEKTAQQTAEKLAASMRDRERRDLELQRERILDQRTSNPHRRAALEAALEQVEARIHELT